MHRSTRYLAGEAGMRQYLDIGTGIPTPPDLHEVAQGIAPAAGVVYADNDPVVLAHTAALVDSTPEGRIASVQADITDPEALLNSHEVRTNLDFTQPIALSLNAVLHFVAADEDVRHIVEFLKNRLAPGSTIAISHLTADFSPVEIRRLVETYARAGTRGAARPRDQFARFFDGWDLVEPGITIPSRWRPAPTDEFADATEAESSCYVGLARMPA